MVQSIENIVTVIILFSIYKLVKKKVLSISSNITLLEFIQTIKNKEVINIQRSISYKHIIFDKKQNTLFIPEKLIESKQIFYQNCILIQLYNNEKFTIYRFINNFILKNIKWINLLILIIFLPTLIDLYTLSGSYLFYGITFSILLIFALTNYFRSLRMYKNIVLNGTMKKFNFLIAENLGFFLFIVSPGYIVTFLIWLFKSDRDESKK